jgi:hypothetical protein
MYLRPKRALDGFELARVLTGVRVDASILLVASAAELALQLVRAREHEAGSVGDEDPVCLAVPVREQTVHRVECRLGVCGEARRILFALHVHERGRHDGAQWRMRDLVQHPFRASHALDALEARYARARELGQRQARAAPERWLIVIVLERPDPLPQPVEQREIFGLSAEQRLTEMDVPLHESWADRAPLEVDAGLARPLGELA